VKEAPKFNTDGSCSFIAMTEQKEDVTVIVPKNHKQKMTNLGSNQIINVSGWQKEGKIRVAANFDVVIEGNNAA
jgi:hypothetical protein